MVKKCVDYGIYVDDNRSSNSDMLLKINDRGVKFLRDKLIGTVVPKQGAGGSGNVGREIEKLVVPYFHPACHNIGTNPGPDLLVYCLDIKSHKEKHDNSEEDNDCAWTIGSISSIDVLFKDYKDTDICAKLQGHIEVRFNDKTNKITSVDVVYYDNNTFQNNFKLAYKESQRTLLEQFHNKNPVMLHPEDLFKTLYRSYSTVKTASGRRYGYFEKGENSGFNFRLPHAGKKRLNKTANTTYTTLFEEKELVF